MLSKNLKNPKILENQKQQKDCQVLVSVSSFKFQNENHKNIEKYKNSKKNVFLLLSF
jgi:hypothetical protein